MVAAISEAASTNRPNPKASSHTHDTHLRNPARPPLLPSEKDNGLVPKRPKSRQVSSRYMSPSPSTSASVPRRCSSPLVSRSTNSTASSTPLSVAASSTSSSFPRSHSVDRRRPATAAPGSVGEVSAASRLLFTSTRSLSVSFQGEAFSLPISKAKAAPNLGNVRKGTPERRKPTPVRGSGAVDQVENSRPWPGRSRSVNVLARSFDCSVDRKKSIGSGIVVGSFQQSMIDESRRASFDGRLSLDLGNAELLKVTKQDPDGNSVNDSSVPTDLTASDTDSVSSGSTSGLQECAGVSGRRSGPRGIVVSARFWQETNSRLRRLQDPGSPLSTSPGSRMAVAAKFIQSKKFPSDPPLASPRTMMSPIRGATRSASPSKLMASSMPVSSPIRASSPARLRNAVASPLSSSSSIAPSILSFSIDVRRGKMGENRIVDAHLLRLLYNRHLQWRFVNARADAALLVQRMRAERNLWNAWITISKLRDSVTSKRMKLQWLRRKLKLTSILKGQMAYLEEWALLERDHSSSLHGAIEALKASTLRLPVVGAIADIQSLKDAVGSAVDVMQAMASSICSLLSKVEEMNSLVVEIADVTAKERALLEQCRDFLSTLAAMQVKYSSLRTHILQLNRLPATSSLTTTLTTRI